MLNLNYIFFLKMVRLHMEAPQHILTYAYLDKFTINILITQLYSVSNDYITCQQSKEQNTTAALISAGDIFAQNVVDNLN